MKITTALIILMLGVVPAFGQQAPRCAPRNQMIEFLKHQFMEKPVAVGIAGKGLMEIFTSRKKSWTILITNTEKISCILAAGNDFETLGIPL